MSNAAVPVDGTHTVTSSKPAPVEGLPVGLCAYPVYRERYEEGVQKGSSRLLALRIEPAQPPALGSAEQALQALDDSNQRFILASSTRRGGTVTRRYPVLEQLAPLILAGVVTVTTQPPGVDGQPGAVLGWELTTATLAYAARVKGDALDRGSQLQGEALSLAQRIHSDVPEAKALAAALELPRDTGRLDVYVAAAQALLAGETYLGVRDFSSRLRDDTKAVDADKALTDIGMSKQLRQRLGVLKYPELSISGPVAISQGSGRLTTQGLGSLVTVPFTATPMTVSTTANELVVVENKEAAGYLARTLPGHAVVWSSGFNGAEFQQVLSELAPVCPRAWVVCDADTDGVHIANLVVRCVPHAIVVDVGSMSGAKPRRERSYEGTRTLRTIIDNPATAPQVRRFAEQVDARGYEVEQEEFMPQVLGLITHG
ncbi:hypothetical protein [Streptomyces sp. NPDC002785]|uniref:hypothetical protein n=1 Tax=Streptomyces sp. NPDC002785 TaxID=3154543 RepID=UPI0033203312